MKKVLTVLTINLVFDITKEINTYLLFEIIFSLENLLT